MFIADGFMQNIVLQTGPLHLPFEALRGCVGENYTAFGIDLVPRDKNDRPPQRRNFGDWAERVSQHYPVS